MCIEQRRPERLRGERSEAYGFSGEALIERSPSDEESGDTPGESGDSREDDTPAGGKGGSA